MIRYIKHVDINFLKWDRVIQEAVNGNVYAYSWYLNIVSPEWDALVMDDYVAVMPLTVKSKYGICFMYQPFFAQQLGVYSTSVLSQDLVNTFLSAIPPKIRLIDYHLNIFNSCDSSSFECVENQNYELDLILSYDRIYKGYSKNLKRNLKKAEKANLSLVDNIRPEEICTLFRNNQGREVKHWGDVEYRRFVTLVYKAIHAGMAFTRGVYDSRNVLLGGAVFFKNKSKIVFIFSGTELEARNYAVLPFILDQTIREYSQSATVFDFEGSNKASLARFYRGFGATRVPYFRIKSIRFPFPLNYFFTCLKG